jgi:6-phosphogluconolactonase (cycloisomerase 2 family)
MYLAAAHASSPFITIYKRDGDTFTKLNNPNILPGNNFPSSTGYSTAFSPDGTYLAIAHNQTPFITIYKRSGDTFTKLSNPATLPPTTGQGVAFSPDGTYLAVAHSGSPFITIYKRSGDTFTKLTNPATLPTGTGRGTAFSTDGTYLAVAHNTSPFITIYERSGDTFTKLTDPATLPTFTGGFSAAYGTAFSSSGTYLAVAHSDAPNITIYKYNYQPL